MLSFGVILGGVALVLGATTLFMIVFEVYCTWLLGGWQFWERRPRRQLPPAPAPPLEGGTYRTPPVARP